MDCPSCGNPISSTARFCGTCGASINRDEPAPLAATATAVPASAFQSADDAEPKTNGSVLTANAAPGTKRWSSDIGALTIQIDQAIRRAVDAAGLNAALLRTKGQFKPGRRDRLI